MIDYFARFILFYILFFYFFYILMLIFKRLMLKKKETHLGSFFKSVPSDRFFVEKSDATEM